MNQYLVVLTPIIGAKAEPHLLVIQAWDHQTAVDIAERIISISMHSLVLSQVALLTEEGRLV